MNRLRSWWRRARSVRGRAVLSLGVVASLSATGTLAYWTDEATISGTTLTSGTIDLKVGGQDSVTGYTDLDLSAMVPGNSTAATITVQNTGTAPLQWTLASSYSDTGGPGLGAALSATVTDAASISGTAPAETCGGTTLSSATALGGALVSPGRPLAAGASETVCLQITLDATASSALQGTSTAVTLAFTGTSP